MRFLHVPWRAICLLVFLLLSTVSCGSREVLFVTLVDVPSAAQSILVKTALDGLAGADIQLSGNQPAFTIDLPPSRGGQVVLNATAQDSTGCVLATGTATAQISVGLVKSHDVQLPMSVGQGRTCPVTISIVGAPADASTLQIVATMGGSTLLDVQQPASQTSASVTPKAGQSGSLAISVQARDAGSCKTASGQAMVVIDAANVFAKQVTVTLSPVAGHPCPVDIAITSGQGTIASNPPGLSCNQVGSVCSAEFPSGTKVQVTGTWDGLAFYGTDFTGDCVGSTCSLTVNTKQSVKVAFLPRVCVQGNFCWSTPSAFGTDIFGVWVDPAGTTWVTGSGGSILRNSGTGWSIVASGTPNKLNAVNGIDANNIWSVGDAGTILKWNGTQWTTQPSGVSATLRHIWIFDANNVWVVGDSGTILKWNGTSWSQQTSGTSQNLFGVFGTSLSNVWAVGLGGTIV